MITEAGRKSIKIPTDEQRFAQEAGRGIAATKADCSAKTQSLKITKKWKIQYCIQPSATPNTDWLPDFLCALAPLRLCAGNQQGKILLRSLAVRMDVFYSDK